MQSNKGPTPIREAEAHRLVAGAVCLDFANTLNGHRRRQGHEYLHDCYDLLLWGRHAKVITRGQTRKLLREAALRPFVATEVFQNAVSLREAIFRIFEALANGRGPTQDGLDRLNVAWREGQRHARVVGTADRFDLGWDDDPSLKRIARAVSASAISLLTSDKVGQVRACAGENCDWLFLDSSRNHLRRWCSMAECGNRAKMRRRQGRKQATRAR